jgi:uncharacterized protein YbjT (DUF2867 family)
MTVTNKTILVLGATGRQGGATARHLLSAGWRVRALVRNPNSMAAQTLHLAGIELVEGDFEDEAALSAAMRDVYGVFSVQASVDEVRQGQRIAEVARAASIRHFVYTSVQSAEALARAGDDHKWKIEQHIQELKLPATILRPSFFMETLAVGPLPGVPDDTFSIPIDADVQMGLIAVQDIGAFSALAFEHPDEYLGKTIELAGDALTPPQIADAVSRVTRRSIHYVQTPIETVYQQNPQIAGSIEYLNQTGYATDIAALHKLHPGLMDFDTWLNSGDKAIFAMKD